MKEYDIVDHPTKEQMIEAIEQLRKTVEDNIPLRLEIIRGYIWPPFNIFVPSSSSLQPGGIHLEVHLYFQTSEQKVSENE